MGTKLNLLKIKVDFYLFLCLSPSFLFNVYFIKY